MECPNAEEPSQPICEAFDTIRRTFGRAVRASTDEEAKSAEKEDRGYGGGAASANTRPSVLGRLAKYSPPHAEK